MVRPQIRTTSAGNGTTIQDGFLQSGQLRKIKSPINREGCNIVQQMAYLFSFQVAVVDVFARSVVVLKLIDRCVSVFPLIVESRINFMELLIASVLWGRGGAEIY